MIIITDTLRLEKAITIIEGTGYPVFGTDIGKDEVEANSSFFIFEDEGNISKAESSKSQYSREFVLSFLTKKGATINPIELIETLKPSGLHFKSSDSAHGKMANTDEEAKMTTLIFTRIITVR